MPLAPSPSVDLQTDPTDVPALPDWFGEVAVLAQHLTHRGTLEGLCHEVHLARGRMGDYEVIDFVALLFGYAASGERTLEAYFDRLIPFASPFMALFGREHLPHRSTLSRFLAALDTPCLDALRSCFEHDLVQRGPTGEACGGLLDRQGQRLLIFDVDGTRQAARQRPLATGSDLPTPRRRLDSVCAPGYTGRKRGEVVRTRSTVLQAHLQQWLGTFGHAGNGDYSAELLSACRVIASYLQATGLGIARGLLRLDGLYGTASILGLIQRYGLGFVARGRDYQLLDHPRVQARLQRPCDQVIEHPETHVRRELFEVGYLTDWLEPVPGLELICRVIVTRRPAPSTPEEVAVGKLIDGQVYELFLTSHPAHGLSAADIVDLYQHRGAFEQVLSDEDQEQDPDRWCSHTPTGQEFWQIISQWVWNLRLELGQVVQDQPLRWTCWSEPDAPVSPPSPRERTEAARGEAPVAEEVVDLYGPPELSQEWAKARGRFAGQDFDLRDDGTVECPAGKILRPRERRMLPTGDVRILYAAKAADCRGCELASQCLGSGASGTQPRRVSAISKLLGQHHRPTDAPWQVPEPVPSERPEAGTLLWCDRNGRRVRRSFVALLRRQSVAITRVEPKEPIPPASIEPRLWTRAERAHRRLTWADRAARNASTDTLSYSLTLFGIGPALTAYLGLPSPVAA